MKYRRLEAITLCPTVYRRDPFGVLVLLTLAVLCGPLTVHPRTPANNAALTLPEFVGGIVVRSAELAYVTEQDSEVFAFYRNTPVKNITPGVFLELIKRPGETKLLPQPWSTFFQLRTQNDTSGRWRNLQTYLEQNLTEKIVFRLQRDAPHDSQYDLYVVGIFNGDTVVGVQMFGVAT